MQNKSKLWDSKELDCKLWDFSMNRSNTMQILRRWRARSWQWWMIPRWCGSSRTLPSRAMWSTTKSATSSARWSRNVRTGRPEVGTKGTRNQSSGPRGTSAQMCVCMGNSTQVLGDLNTAVCESVYRTPGTSALLFVHTAQMSQCVHTEHVTLWSLTNLSYTDNYNNKIPL